MRGIFVEGDCHKVLDDSIGVVQEQKMLVCGSMEVDYMRKYQQ